VLVLELATINRSGIRCSFRIFSTRIGVRTVRTFFRGKNESVVINDEISVTVLDIDGDEVVLAIDAPEWMEIDVNEASLLEDEVEEWSLLQPR
jgi:carbon storage regulator CsrA